MFSSSGHCELDYIRIKELLRFISIKYLTLFYVMWHYVCCIFLCIGKYKFLKESMQTNLINNLRLLYQIMLLLTLKSSLKMGWKDVLCSSISFHVFFFKRYDVFIKSGIANLAKLASQLCMYNIIAIVHPGILLYPPVVTDMCHPSQQCCRGPELRFSCLYSKNLTH